MKRVIVTGATGFVGANLARRLLHTGHEVHLLVRPGSERWRIEDIRADVRLHELHLENASTVAPVVKRIRPEWVFHLAAHGAYSSQTDWQQMVQTNLCGTANLVSACLPTGFEALVNTGTSSEYGLKAHAPLESEVLEPNSHYAVTKAAATLYCQHAAKSHRVHLPTLRLYSVYGPYEDPQRLLPTLILAGLQGQLPPLVNPKIARDFVYVDDVVEAYLLAATVQAHEFGPVYNIGTGVQTKLREVVKLARRVLNVPAKPAWGTMPNRKWDTDSWICDNRKAQAALGWRPRHDLEAGFRKMVAWFQQAAPPVYGAKPERSS